MKKLFNLLKDRFKISALNKLIVEHEVRDANLLRSLFVTGFSLPVSILGLLFYYYNLKSGEGIATVWVENIMYLNIFLSVILLLLFCITYLSYRKRLQSDLICRAIPSAVFIVMALWGTMATTLDQAVTSSIAPFMLCCIICSMSLLIQPLRLLFYLGIIFMIFCFGIYHNQEIPTVVMSNLTNGFSTIVICFGLAIIQWRNNMTRFRQNRVIESQQETLAENYKQLLNSSEQLEELNSSKDKFFAILAHDLRGPISSTLALTELLEEGFFEKDESERKRMYKLLQSSLNTTGKLLENVLLWSRNQTGNLTFKPQHLNLHEVINNNISFLKIVAAQKDIQVHNFSDENIEILADLDMINTVFRNLISNALKFTPNFGKVELSSGFNDDETTQRKFVTIVIRDFGIGMNKKILNNLFKIDIKTISLGTNNEKGTGLGLIICQDFIHKHGGKLVVESQEGLGSTFSISLPYLQMPSVEQVSSAEEMSCLSE